MSKRFERICENGHQFTTDTSGAADCPKCGAAARSGLAVSTDTEPLGEITAGGELWYESIGALEQTLRWQALLWFSGWIGEYLALCYRAAIGLAVWRGLRNLRPLAWYECKVIPGQEMLRINLSQAELADCADEMAKLSARLEDIADRRAAANASFKAEAEDAQNDLAQIADRVRAGEERLVAVDTVHDYRVGVSTRIRRDTGEILSERPLTGEERQAAMFEDEKPSKKRRKRPEAEDAEGSVEANP